MPEVEKKKVGGARPGAGRPPEMKDRTRVSFYVEGSTKARLLKVAEVLNDLIAEENKGLPEEERDNVASASEIARFAIRNELESLRTLSNDDAARRFRPYLGMGKPDLVVDDDDEPGRIFLDRQRMVTYLEKGEKADLEMHADRINSVVDRANKQVEMKKDQDHRVAWSEIARFGVSQMFEQYGRRAYALAGALRPYLGMVKP